MKIDLDSATKLLITINSDGMIQSMFAFVLQEEKSRTLALLDIQNILNIKVIAGQNTFPGVFKAGLERKAGNRCRVGQCAVLIVERYQLR